MDGETTPFDYKKLSKVAHPQDWDPQAEVFPMDIDLEWGGIPKPDGWSYPTAYTEARANGEAEKIRQLVGEVRFRLPAGPGCRGAAAQSGV